MLIAIFSGWIMTRQSLLEELGVQNVALATFLQIVLRYIAPALIFVIFYTSLT
jgi:SNF family Na+-dependent transporter